MRDDLQVALSKALNDVVLLIVRANDNGISRLNVFEYGFIELVDDSAVNVPSRVNAMDDWDDFRTTACFMDRGLQERIKLSTAINHENTFFVLFD